jgi:NADP-dependent aldehyde dehydrogenase
MNLTGEMLIGGIPVRGGEGSFRAVDPSTGAALEPEFFQGGQAEVDRAARLADAAFEVYRATSPATRADFLDTIAANLEGIRPELVARAAAETGLLEARLNSETDRTTGQLRLFATLLRGGTTTGVRIDPAQPARTPLPRLDIRQRLIPLGPVAVFGSSNFPLAFSTAGGDTASALAAGCPVIVKVHNAHPGTAMLAAGAIAEAVAAHGLPEGVFSALIGRGASIGAALVAHPLVSAVGFTGSRSGGLALVAIAQQRRRPIPVYAEMSSINPVVIFPSRATAEVAAEFVGSLTLGSGQFCTNPGVVFVPAGSLGDAFAEATAERISAASGQTMLTAGIDEAFRRGVAALRAVPGVAVLGEGTAGGGENAPEPVVFTADAALLASEPALQDEMFGAAALVLRYESVEQLSELLSHLDGQLTATVHAGPEEADAVRALLPVLERTAGRILYNGWPTGVEVNHAMVHGGPFPSTSDARTTSVGTLAITRFQRPVAYQNLPDELLPEPVADRNPWRQVRFVDGAYETGAGGSSR